MKIEYRISEGDYLQAMKLHCKMSRRKRLFLSLFFSVLILAMFFNATTLPALIAGLVVLLLNHLLLPFFARRQYRKYKAIQNLHISIEIRELGLYFTSTNGSGLTTWQNIYQWRQDNDFILIYLAPRLYQMIPKKQAANISDANELSQLLYQHVGQPK